MDNVQLLLINNEAHDKAKSIEATEVTKAGDDAEATENQYYVTSESACYLPTYYRDKTDRRVKLEIFKDSPFLSLLKFKSESRSMALCTLLANSYGKEEAAFFIQGKCIKLCIEEAGVVLGMKNEGVNHSELTSNMATIPDYYNNCIRLVVESGVPAEDLSPPLNRKSMATVLKHMNVNGENSEIYKKIMYVYLCGFVFSCQTVPKINAEVFGYVEDIDKFEKVNWLAFIFSTLKSNLERACDNIKKSRVNKGKFYFTCCTYFLEAWYYYRTEPCVDAILSETPEAAAIEYFLSYYTRLAQWEKHFKPDQVKRRCLVCLEEEEKIEKEGKVEGKFLLEKKRKVEEKGKLEKKRNVMEKAKLENAPPPRTFQTKTKTHCFEQQCHLITEEIGEELLQSCVNNVMKDAKLLGFTESSNELLDMMVDHVNAEARDSWSLVEAFLSYKPKEEEFSEEVVNEPHTDEENGCLENVMMDQPEPLSSSKPCQELQFQTSDVTVNLDMNPAKKVTKKKKWPQHRQRASGRLHTQEELDALLRCDTNEPSTS